MRMRRKPKISSISFLAVMLFAASGTLGLADEGGINGGGGTATKAQEKLVFFDLRNNVKALGESNPGLKVVKKTKSGVTPLKFYSVDVRLLPGFKYLSSIPMDPAIRDGLLARISDGMPWVFTNAALKELNDVAYTKDEKTNPLFQAAIYDGDHKLVFANYALLSKLSPMNQAALLVHEAIRVSFPGMKTEKVQDLTVAILNNQFSKQDLALALSGFKQVSILNQEDVALIRAAAKQVNDPGLTGYFSESDFFKAKIQEDLGPERRQQSIFKSRIELLKNLQDLRNQTQMLEANVRAGAQTCGSTPDEIWKNVLELNRMVDHISGKVATGWVDDQRANDAMLGLTTAQIYAKAKGFDIRVETLEVK